MTEEPLTEHPMVLWTSTEIAIILAIVATYLEPDDFRASPKAKAVVAKAKSWWEAERVHNHAE